MMTPPEAEQHYQQILLANPRQAPVWCLLGEARLRLGKLVEAAAAYQNALRLEPASADGHFGLANVCKEQGKRAEAISCYRRGLERASDHAEALLNLGVLLAEQGEVDEAIGHWQHLLGMRPDHAQAHHNLGVALAQKGRFDEAVQSLERAHGSSSIAASAANATSGRSRPRRAGHCSFRKPRTSRSATTCAIGKNAFSIPTRTWKHCWNTTWSTKKNARRWLGPAGNGCASGALNGSGKSR